MACSRFFTNDELKHRVRKVYAKFVSDVDPDRLSDWLVQEGVISIEQWQRVRHENHTTADRCRALLHHLFSTQHPRAFLVVRLALCERNHYLLEYIDNQKLGGQPHTETILQDKKEIQQLKKDNEDQKRAWKEEKDRLLKIQEEHEDQKRAWKEEKRRLLRTQKEHEDQKRAWEAERDRLLKMSDEYETKLHLGCKSNDQASSFYVFRRQMEAVSDVLKYNAYSGFRQMIDRLA